MHQVGQPSGPAGGRRRGIPAMAERRAARVAESAAIRKQRASEDRARREQRRTEDRERRKQRRAEDREQRQARRAEDTEIADERRAVDLSMRKERRAERALARQWRKDQKLYRREVREARKLERREQRTLRRAERAEERQRQRAERAEDRQRKQAEERERRRLKEAAKREQQERRKAEQAEKRARHAAAVAERRDAEAAARDLLKQARAEARRVQRHRKAEDAELRKRRKAEDAERRKAVATDVRVRVHKKRRWALWLGLGMLAVGLSLAGYLGWQLWGTNWLSQRTHERIVEDVREEWEVSSSTTLSRDVVPTVDVPEGQVSGLIRIPEFGDDYVVPVLEGTGDKVLASGFGHFEDSADPGDVGNYALAAHRVTHGEPLRDMPELEVGDEVIVETRYATYTYELITDGDDLRVTFRDYWVVDSLPTNPDPNGIQPAQRPGQRLITLTTCAELFHTDDRLIAFGVLTDTDLKS